MQDDQIEELEEDVIEESTEEGQSSEDRARSYGWKPKEEYKGKGEWVDADAFLEKTEENPENMRTSLKMLERNYTKLEKNTEAILAHQQRQIEHAEKQGYERAMKDVEGRISQAVEDGDAEEVQKAIKDRDSLQVRKPQADLNVGVVQEWKARNTWFENDPILADAATRFADLMAAKGKNPKEQLEAAEKYVKETFPHKFETRKVRQAPHMNGSDNNVIRRTKGKAGTYEGLNAASKVECDRFVKEVVARGHKVETAKAEWLRYASQDAFE